MKFELDQNDINTIGMAESIASMSEDFTASQFRRLVSLVKKINSQIPTVNQSSTRRIKVYDK